MPSTYLEREEQEGIGIGMVRRGITAGSTPYGWWWWVPDQIEPTKSNQTKTSETAIAHTRIVLMFRLRVCRTHCCLL